MMREAVRFGIGSITPNVTVRGGRLNLVEREEAPP